MDNPAEAQIGRRAAIQWLLWLTAGGVLARRPLLGAPAAANPPSDHLGLQLWSLRDQFKKNVPSALADAEGFGFKIIETAGTYGLSAGDFHTQLEAHGLKAVSAHFGYAEFDADAAGVIARAQALGVEYVIIPMIPHHPLHFSAEEARVAAAKFNAWGAAVQAAGMKFGYHTHGYEFTPDAASNGEIPFEVLAAATQPDLVLLQMDVFWVAHAGVDPVQLLAKYPGRWRMLHLKDLRVGAPTDASGAAPATDDVPVGQGRIPWPQVFAAARDAGVVYNFIEDESVAPLQNIPISLRYLEAFHL